MLATDMTGFPDSILIVGEPGSGKTWFIRTIVEAAKQDGWDMSTPPVFVFACDPGKFGGQLTNAGVEGIEFEVYHKPVYTIRHKPYKQWSLVKQRINHLYDLFESGKQPYYAVVLDSITGLQDMIMTEVMFKQRGSDGMFAGGQTSSGAELGVTPTQPEWGQEIMMFLATMSSLVDLPCYSIIIAHQKERPTGMKAGKDDIVKLIPAIYGKAAPEITASKFDEIFTFHVEGSALQRRFVAKTRPDLLVTRRSRSNLFPAVMEQDFRKWREIGEAKLAGNKNI